MRSVSVHSRCWLAFDHFFRFKRFLLGSLQLLNAKLKTVEASALLQPFNSSVLCEPCMKWQLKAPPRAPPAPWVGPAADALESTGAEGAVCVLPA